MEGARWAATLGSGEPTIALKVQCGAARQISAKALNMTPESPSPKGAPQSPTTPGERKRVLAWAVAIQIAQGARLESQSDYQAVVARGLRLHNNHGLTITGGEKRSVVAVDEFGNVALRAL